MESQDLIKALAQARVVGVLRAPSASSAIEAAQAAVRGGLRALEVALTTPGALEALRTLRTRLPGYVRLGAGTVMDTEQGRLALEAGAEFLVSPHLGEDLLALGVPYVPGVLSPSEVVRALRLGATVVKIFPAGSSGGVAYIKDLLGPFPGLKILATGGIQPDEVPAYLQAEVLAVGLGSNLFPKSALEQGQWAAVETTTRQTLAAAGVL